MKGTKTLRATAVVALATAVGLGFGTPAQAALTIDSTVDDSDTGKRVIYAQETLMSAGGSKVIDGVTYYNITTDGAAGRDHTIVGPAEIGGKTTDRYYVTYKLTGMVFMADPTIAPADLEMQSGVMDKDTATFVMSGSSDVDSSDDITLTAKFRVSADGGSISRSEVNATLAGLPGIPSSDHLSLPGAVQVMPALKETVMSTEPAPVAQAVSNFTRLGGSDQNPVTHAKIGSLKVGIMGTSTATYYRNASNNQAVDALADIAPADNDSAAPHNNNVTVGGNTSFLKKAGIGFVAANGCTASATITDIRKFDDDGNPTSEFVAQNLDGFSTEMALCVMADGKTAIPAGDYTVTTAYKGLTGAAFPTEGATHTIGTIKRDGTQFNLPFLSDSDKLKQRITIQNRGQASTWNLTDLETMGDSVTAVSGMDTGDLPVGQTVIKVWEHIDVMGASRASGSITIPLPPGVVSASVDIVNTETGGIATTMLTAE